jgi:hypothetical protein
MYPALSTFLLLAVGLKGGTEMAEAKFGDLVGPMGATIALGLSIPFLIFFAARKLGKLSVADSAALAAHYGSVSAVTFTAGQAFLQSAGTPAPGFAPALVALMEIPGIIVALFLAHSGGPQDLHWKEAVHEIVTGRSVMLLLGGLLVGALASHRFEIVKPFFVDPFKGVLCLFMLEMGTLAVERLSDLRQAGIFIVILGLVAPVILGTLGVLAGLAVKMGVPGATILGVLSASASYIAAPAAVRIALPDAKPGYYLTASIGITFPFNLTLGIPLYYFIAKQFGG